MNEEQALAGGSLPYLCFLGNVSSLLCNHTPVQRETILDNCELNPDLSYVSVQGERSVPDKCRGGGSAVRLLCDSLISGLGLGPGSPPLPPVPGVCVGA